MQRIKLILALVFIAFLISMYFAGTGYFEQVDRIDAANVQLDEVQGQINAAQLKLASVPQVDENEISQLESKLASEMNRLPSQSTVVQNEVIRTILGLGYKHAVTVVPLQNSQWSGSSFVSDTTYQSLTMSFQAQGSWNDLIEFLKDLELTNYTTLAVDQLDGQLQPAELDENGEVISVGNPIFNLSITVYTK